jgi:hypothetical protein
MNFDGKITMRPLSLLGATTVSNTTPVYSVSVEPSGYRYTLFVLNQFSATAVVYTASLQESDDNVNFTDIGEVVSANVAATVNAKSFLVRHEAAKRYTRVRFTRDSGANTIIGVTAVQYGKINSSEAASLIPLVSQ